jgi:hypothetical protein
MISNRIWKNEDQACTHDGKKKEQEKKSETYPMCFPPPALLFHEPSIDCITISATESGSTHDAPLKATAN